jgi:hypothetical protein
MNARPQTVPERVLVVGRSPSVLLETVEILRNKGFVADATNQFESILDDYDVTKLDILVFGGMVPPDTKRYLREHVGARNPDVTFIQGLVGIAGVIAAQVTGAARGDAANNRVVSYDTERRLVQVNLDGSAHVTIDAYWATSFTPPEPKSTSMRVLDSDLDKGLSIVALPAEVPSEASFVTVAVGTTVQAFMVGPMPQRVLQMVPTGGSSRLGRSALPPVSPVSTHSHH